MRVSCILAIFLSALFLSACSTSGTPITPNTPDNTDLRGYQEWGDFALMFDPETGESEINYLRQEAVHYNITSFLEPPACGGSGCVTATLVFWNPATNVARFNVTITNPSPWTPSDVRLIFYNLGGKDIVNRDSYTRSFLTNVCPFIAFGKMNPNRVFPAGAPITETVDIYWPPMSPFSIYFKVTAYLWLNCQDPYEINGMYQNGVLKPSGGSAQIGCTVLDWQNDVTMVRVNTTPITGGITNLAPIGGGVWEATITNAMGVSPATYTCLIAATSPNPQNFDLYNYINIVISPQGWGIDGEWALPSGRCTLDFGIIANAPAGHALVVMMDANNVCSEVWKYPGWGGIPTLYASLRNLDPTNPLFQPYPVERIDAADDGAFGWTNSNSKTWRNNPNVAGINTYCNFDNQPKFSYNPESDDHRHYLIWMQELALRPIDCCDDFKLHQCALYVDLSQSAVGFHGIPGANLGFDYTDADIIWEAIFPPALVGREPGQIDPADVSGIDTMLSEQNGVMILYVAQEVNQRVEVFLVIDAGPGPVDVVTHFNTIWVFDETGLPGQPVDIELLPPHEKYEKLPNMPILCVLIDNAKFPVPPPGFGGSVWIYDAMGGNFVDRIGDGVNPAVTKVPEFIDTDDKEWSVHIMQQGPVVTKYDYF